MCLHRGRGGGGGKSCFTVSLAAFGLPLTSLCSVEIAFCAFSFIEKYFFQIVVS